MDTFMRKFINFRPFFRIFVWGGEPDRSSIDALLERTASEDLQVFARKINIHVAQLYSSLGIMRFTPNRLYLPV